MQSKITGRGYAILVKAYCGAGHLGAARDYLAKVPRPRKAGVIRYCQSRHEIDLAN
jgi:hypothetical protein